MSRPAAAAGERHRSPAAAAVDEGHRSAVAAVVDQETTPCLDEMTREASMRLVTFKAARLQEAFPATGALGLSQHFEDVQAEQTEICRRGSPRQTQTCENNMSAI